MIIMLILVNFSMIVKIGVTIKYGSKTEKIVRVAILPEFSGLLTKKRQDISSISYASKSNKPSLYLGSP